MYLIQSVLYREVPLYLYPWISDPEAQYKCKHLHWCIFTCTYLPIYPCLQGRKQCCALEEAMLGVEQKVGIGSCFPVTVGRRPDKTHRRGGAGVDQAGRSGPLAVGR